MNDLSAFGKSLQTSLSAAGAELSSVASSTGTELMNFGREIGRDGAELGAHTAERLSPCTSTGSGSSLGCAELRLRTRSSGFPGLNDVLKGKSAKRNTETKQKR